MSHFNGHWPLSMELLRWSLRDRWTLEQAVEGVLITGAIGSGKTSGPFNYILRALLRCGCGGLFLCAKKDAANEYIRLAELEGRAKDVVSFSIENKQGFNFLTYEATRHGVGKGIIENVVLILMQAQEVVARKSSHQQGDDFFEGAMKELLRNCLEVIITATGKVDLLTILEIVETLPQSIADVRMPEGLRALDLLEEAERIAPERAQDLALARSYFTRAWPRLADRTRSSIAQTLSVLLDSFVRYPIRELLSSQTTCTPDDVLAGKIVIVDVPVKEFDHIGKIVGVIWKYCLQRAIERRVETGGYAADALRPVFIAADEAQFWATKWDAQFQQTARAARGITVYSSQNLPNFYAEIGGDPTAKAHVDSLLGNLQTRLACQNAEPQTNEWYANSVGKVLKRRRNQSRTFGSSFSQTSGYAEQMDFDVQPREFTTLKAGSRSNGYCVEAILTAKSREFRANKNKRWLRVMFHQGFAPTWWQELLLSRPFARITAPRREA